MLRLYLILAFMAYNGYAPAQTVRARTDCFNTGAYHETFTDALSAGSNPAALAFCRAFTAGAYSGRKFMLNGLQHFIIAAAVPVAKDGIGLQAEHFKTPGYRQTVIALGYAKKLGPVIIGARFHYNSIIIPVYGKTGNLDIEAGSNWRLTDDLRLGMCVYLPAGNTWKSAYRYRAGIGYAVSPQLLFVIEAGREENRPVNIHSGIYYKPTTRWLFQLGVISAGAQPYACTAFQWGTLRIAFSVTYSMQLGPAPGMAVLHSPSQNSTP